MKLLTIAVAGVVGWRLLAILGSMAAPRSPLSRLFTVLLAGVLAGLVLAVAALPGNLLLGLTARSRARVVRRVAGRAEDPGHAAALVPLRQRRQDADHHVLRREPHRRRRWTEIAPVMRQAIVAAEDRALLRPRWRRPARLAAGAGGQRHRRRHRAGRLDADHAVRAQRAQDDPTPHRRSSGRRATADTPRRARSRRSGTRSRWRSSSAKDEILDRYLNIAYFGSGAYGIAAASQRYFGKPPAQLTLAEAALLAGLVQSPGRVQPDQRRPGRGAGPPVVRAGLDGRHQRDHRRAGRAGQGRAAGPARHAQPNGCTAVSQRTTTGASSATTCASGGDAQPAVRRDRRRARAGAAPGRLHRGHLAGPEDPGHRAAAGPKVYGYDNERALPIAAVQPGTGRVLAMAVNRHYSLAANPAGQANYPNTVNPLISGGAASTGYQAGSTFKLFTMLAALESGVPCTPASTRPPADHPVRRPRAPAAATATGARRTPTRTGWTATG